MRTAFLLSLTGLMAAPAVAGSVTITVPQMKVAEYHRPYVAVWLEPAAGGPARTLALWYDVKNVGAEPGTRWLSELRSWWRKGGRSLAVPADGITGATRPPGSYKIPLPADLKPGDYRLNIEAARETGGREILTLSVKLPGGTGRVAGTSELGAISLTR